MSYDDYINSRRWRNILSHFAGFVGSLTQIVKRSDAAGFEVLPKRWIVERIFAWISRCRRLARDFELYTRTTVGFVRLAMIRIMLRRLAANPSS